MHAGKARTPSHRCRAWLSRPHAGSRRARGARSGRATPRRHPGAGPRSGAGGPREARGGGQAPAQAGGEGPGRFAQGALQGAKGPQRGAGAKRGRLHGRDEPPQGAGARPPEHDAGHLKPERHPGTSPLLFASLISSFSYIRVRESFCLNIFSLENKEDVSVTPPQKASIIYPLLEIFFSGNNIKTARRQEQLFLAVVTK